MSWSCRACRKEAALKPLDNDNSLRHGFGGRCYNPLARARPASRTIDVHRLDLARVSSRRLAVM
jgi:hypothetical protein